ncbi:MAG: mechanosensitive ion channel [Chitinophagales bacterium]|nr:mechanosensitive ion channel [Chitinophagales bacterium]
MENTVGNTLSPIFATDDPLLRLLGAAGALVVALALHMLFFYLLKRIAKRRQSVTLKAIVDKMAAPSRLLIAVITLTASVPFMGLESDIQRRVQHIAALTNIAAVAWLLIKIVAVVKVVVVHRYDIRTADNLMARKVYTQFEVIENIVIVLICIVSVGIGLMTFERIREIGMSLLASAGIAGIVLGLAAQRVIGTILAGLQIAFTQPIRIDDVVIIEGEFGRIQEINLTHVVVAIWDKRRMIVPTTWFIENPFQNWTHSTAALMGTVFIYTSVEVPVEAVRAELTRLLSASPLWDKEVNALQVTDMSKDGTVELRALMSAGNASALWDLRVYIREKLLEYLRTEYSSIPYTKIALAPESLEPLLAVTRKNFRDQNHRAPDK